MKFEHTGIDNKVSASRGWQSRSIDGFTLAQPYNFELAEAKARPPDLTN
jgi:hypothetical protein